MLLINEIIQGDCLNVMKEIPNEFIDLTITSPPYDNLRDYNGYVFDFEGIANELYRITKNGGVVVWVVGDATINGSETGTSFRQALYFKEIGFNLHDTMIYQKNSYSYPPKNRYYQQFEYMFVLSKGTPFYTNLLKQKGLYTGTAIHTQRDKNGETKRFISTANKERIKDNIWKYETGYMKTTKDKFTYKHPAMFPEQLVNDHIISWSNENDIVLDPMCGSGTTCKMAKINNRKFIGIDISEEYCEIARQRVNNTPKPLLV
jgi:DNA modification methylase